MAFGCTIGNYISGIRVRKFGEEEKRINIFSSYLRFIVKFSSVLFLSSQLLRINRKEPFTIWPRAQ
ncbi:MAG: hypothetical protein IPH04_01390 [Saprospirales bacterium]|nr:hypothetical protein [Saprospirales bacterium]